MSVPGLDDPLVDLPRPDGDADDLLTAAARLRRAAATLGEAAARATAPGTTTAWHGTAAAAFADARATTVQDLRAVAERLSSAASGVVPLAAALADAQRTWDRARLLVERDTADQVARRAAVLAEAAAVRARNAARAVAGVTALGPPLPEPEPTFVPASDSPARLEARRAAAGALAAVEREEQRCAERLRDAVAGLAPVAPLPAAVAPLTATVGSVDPVGPPGTSGWSLSGALVPARPGEWARLALPADGLCPPDAGYEAGGVVVGPDGRRYPVVVPWVLDERGKPVHLDAHERDLRLDDLDGRDPGWRELRTVHEEVDLDLPSAGAVAAVLLTGATAVTTTRADLLPSLRVSPTGAATLPARRGALGRPPDDDIGASSTRPTRRDAGSGVAGLALDRAAGAADVAAQDRAVVTTVLEENVDGRRRALVRAVRVFDLRGVPTVVHSAPVARSGTVDLLPLRVRPPADGVVRAPDDAPVLDGAPPSSPGAAAGR